MKRLRGSAARALLLMMVCRVPALTATLPPGVATNQSVYIYYTASTPFPHHRVSRPVANGNVAMLGKILRIDADGTIYGDRKGVNWAARGGWNAGGGGTSATFVGSDTTTQGSWRGMYGADGYVIANDANSPPAYASVTTTGANTWQWTDVTTDVRGLQRAVGSNRFAATWYGSTFNVDVNLTDGAAHQLSLYVVDWDSGSRGQTFEVRDAVTNALLDTRTVTGFSGGQYWRWTVRGHVVVRAQVMAGYNALVSGVFFDGGGAVNVPPTVTLTTPASGVQYTAPATVAIGATATDSDGIAKVEFYQALGQGTPSLIAPAVTTPPYEVTWNNVAAGTYTVTAKAYDTPNASSTTSVQITVGPAGGGGGTAATFIGTDPTTKGTWHGVYGADGYVIANDANSPPAYASVTTTGANTWQWTDVTTDVRGLQRAVGSNRFAATWYGSTFNVDVNITDGAAHQLSLYVLDWEGYGRAETVEVRDAVTNALLDTRNVSSFVGGQYCRWTVRGHVTMRVTNTGTPNAVVSGLFFDTSASGPDATPPSLSITAPAAGTTVSGTATVRAAATDNVGVAGVQFQLDGAPLGAEDTTAPFAVAWNTTAQPAGLHTLTAVARDAAGNRTTSASVPVTVANSTGQVTLAWDASVDPNVTGYKVYIGTASGVYAVSVVEVGNVTSCTIVGLPAGSVYYIVVTAHDQYGNEGGFSNEVSATIP